MTLDPTLVDRICDLLRQGCSVRTTCECVGISESTFFEYMRRGKATAADYAQTFSQFAERVTRARGQGKAYLVGIIRKAAPKDWRAAVALLERLSPAEYARTSPPELRDSAVRTDSGTLEELLNRARASSKPDQEKIDRLQLTLSEVRAANDELVRLVTEWCAEGA